MSNRTKQRRSGGLTLMLFQRALHPEFFRILRSDQAVRRWYEADVWLVDGGHVISFTAGANSLSEVIVTRGEPVTDRGHIQTIPCRGERYHEEVYGETIRYMISTQEEQLTPTLFEATRHEIATYAAKRELMSVNQPATEETGGTLSVLDVEFRSRELLVQSFHLFSDNNLVVKTQGIMEVIED